MAILDVRTPEEYREGHIPGSKNVTLQQLDKITAAAENNDTERYVICQSGLRSYIATRILEGYGFEVYNFAGGFRFYDAVMNDRVLVESALPCGMDQ